MSFVVGQWVTCDGKLCRVISSTQFSVHLEYQGMDFVVSGADSKWPKPFAWQVGETYKTTLDGVAATITGTINETHLVGIAKHKNQNVVEWVWSNSTGLARNVESYQTVPHLLPHLADEPAAFEPKAEVVTHPSRKIREMAAEALAEYEAGKTVEWPDGDDNDRESTRPLPTLTVVIRDDAAVMLAGLASTLRTVRFELTAEQAAKIGQLDRHESIQVAILDSVERKA